MVYGELDRAAHRLLIYSSHVYALPSRYEPFGISALEALAVGTPVVVSDVGGLREYVADLRATPLGVGLRVPPGQRLRAGESRPEPRLPSLLQRVR